MSEPVTVGMIGFGLAGAAFHAPLIRSIPSLSLKAVASSRREDIARAGLAAAENADALIRDPAVDLIVIASPNQTHFPLARAALLAGKHVVVDKPFTVTLEEADALIELARQQDRILTVFHNRRWDGDFLTVKRLIEEGRLGDVALFEACWDRFRPAIKQGWREVAEPGSGLLSDLGPHLIDQALCLFGWPDAVSADVQAQRPEALVDDFFDITLFYGRQRVRLSAASLVVRARPRFAVHGTSASFIKFGLDPQEARLRAGGSPLEPGFGAEDAAQHGTLYAPDGAAATIPTEDGRYLRFYEAVAQAIRAGGPVPVAPQDACAGLAIIELARRSAREGARLEAGAAPEGFAAASPLRRPA